MSLPTRRYPRSRRRCGPGGIQSYQFGEYRTKQAILEIYNEMAQAIRTGNIYQIRVDQPPGPPTKTRGAFADLPLWPAGTSRPVDWPVHIHSPHRSQIGHSIAGGAYPYAESPHHISN